MVGEKNISGNSVIYNVSKDMFMIMDKLLFQVSWLEQDDNILGKIQNEQRIREVTFKEIKRLYSNRINKYKLTTHRLSDDLIDNLVLKGFNFDKSNSESDDSFRTSNGGLANIYPLTFRCNGCGHFIKIQKDLCEFEESKQHKKRNILETVRFSHLFERK